MNNNKKILISACLYGQCTAYDGKHRLSLDKKILEWKNRGMLIPVCPEVSGGLKIPRCPAEIVGNKVITKDGNDVTKEYTKGAEEALKIAKENNVIFAILKDGSPSCGCKHIYDGSFSHTKISGTGICASLLMDNGFLVFSEDDTQTANVFLNEG